MERIETLTKDELVARGWEFETGTVPDSGKIETEPIWSDTFETNVSISGTTRYSTYEDPDISQGAAASFIPRKIDEYSDVIRGLSQGTHSCFVSDGDTSKLLYSHNDKACLSKYAPQSLRGKVFGCHLATKVGGYFEVSPLKVYGNRSTLRFNFITSDACEVRVRITNLDTSSDYEASFHYDASGEHYSGMSVNVKSGEHIAFRVELVEATSNVRFDNFVLR